MRGLGVWGKRGTEGEWVNQGLLALSKRCVDAFDELKVV
jgi:hypothetical protein